MAKRPQPSPFWRSIAASSQPAARDCASASSGTVSLPVRIRHRADQIAREADQPDLPPPLQPLGAQARANLVETAFDMIVAQPIVLAVPGADLLRCSLPPRRHPLAAVG